MSIADRRIDFGPPHFKIAVHTLAWLARSACTVSSSVLAAHVDTHPTFMRRMLQSLAGAGIVESKGGRDGGYRLRTGPSALTLGDIYAAVSNACTAAAADAQTPSSGQHLTAACAAAGQKLDEQLEAILHEAQQQTIRYLHTLTLEAVMTRMEQPDPD
ncbi:Rrf2 family transcriptional regulator [Paenibacillus sp. IB182496]|uniref:Rrf2 family transcriptional regulator n=1 Tax=Paenibacillus sabuli TaxID=2772509 RepID=A0A927BX38_9BACL|nr:Rrf2 family transcriptional regulator [Paenibacillus sabuli]MBD2847099.1 Rrf2 family transcriptional regulator [Paenibacillus sabuli]